MTLLGRMDFLQNSVVYCHWRTDLLQDLGLPMIPLAATGGKAWLLNVLHNWDNIWITKTNKSSIYHPHWKFIVSTIKLPQQSWISYPKPDTTPSSECCCPVWSVYESCSMPVALSISRESQPCLIYWYWCRLRGWVPTLRPGTRHWNNLRLQWVLLKAEATKTCWNVIMLDGLQTKPQRDCITSRYLEATTVYHLAKASGNVLQAGTVCLARTLINFSHCSFNCWGRSASCKRSFVLCSINLWCKVQKDLRVLPHLKFHSVSLWT